MGGMFFPSWLLTVSSVLLRDDTEWKQGKGSETLTPIPPYWNVKVEPLPSSSANVHDSIIPKDPIQQGRQQQQHQESCIRSCPQRINKIYYTHISPAGLRDRLLIMETLGNLAGYLCATLEFPPPHLMLHRRHNHEIRIGMDIEWDDFFNFTWIHQQDQENDRSRVLYTIPAGFHFQSFANHHYSDWLQLTSKTPNDTIGHFLAAERMSFQQQSPNATTGFVWNIDLYFYHMLNYAGKPWNEIVAQQRRPWWNQTSPDVLHRMLPSFLVPHDKGCQYFDSSQVPSHMYHIIQHIWDDILHTTIPHPNQHPPSNTTIRLVGMFHIRRKDTRQECPTELPKMQTYIHCSLEGSETLGTIILLFASDERDGQYRQAIQTMVNEYSHVHLLSLDDLIYRHVQQAFDDDNLPARFLNNYYYYRIQLYLQWKKVAFVLEQHRADACLDCDKLIERPNILWN